MTVVVSDLGEFDVAARDGLWLAPADAERVTGWAPKPEGMCRAEACVPLREAETREGWIDVAAFWRRLGAPVERDDSGAVWVLGAGHEERARALTGDTAPDFALPDLSGVERRLADLRGKKVLLATWASW